MGSEAPELLVAAVGRGLLTGTALLLLTHTPQKCQNSPFKGKRSESWQVEVPHVILPLPSVLKGRALVLSLGQISLFQHVSLGKISS